MFIQGRTKRKSLFYGATMTITVVKLSRLSRNKNIGNILLVITLTLLISFSFTIFRITTSTDIIFTLIGVVFCIISFYSLNKYLRSPYFTAFSKYLRELHDRHFETQQATIKLELIEPFQTLQEFKHALNQVDELHQEVKQILDQTIQEISINSSPTRSPQVQKELTLIKKFATESLTEIKKKRENIVFLAKIRKILFETITKQIKRPRKEIEPDYLQFKLQKYIKDRLIDDYLVSQIINHAIERGEIQGKLERNEDGEMILTVDSYVNYEITRDISQYKTESLEEYCVICRHAIRPSDVRAICPMCENSFHKVHLLEWLKVFNQCPICRSRITLFSNSSEDLDLYD